MYSRCPLAGALESSLSSVTEIKPTLTTKYSSTTSQGKTSVTIGINEPECRVLLSMVLLHLWDRPTRMHDQLTLHGLCLLGVTCGFTHESTDNSRFVSTGLHVFT